MTSPIREEFEKAYHKEYDEYDPCSHLAIALWAAKWMAERCAKHLEQFNDIGIPWNNQCNINEIRAVAKELEER